MIVTIIAALVGLCLGGAVGFFIFRYVIKGKYNEISMKNITKSEKIKQLKE